MYNSRLGLWLGFSRFLAWHDPLIVYPRVAKSLRRHYATFRAGSRSAASSLAVEGGIEKGEVWSFVARLRLDAHVRIVNTRQDSSPAHQKT